MRLCLIDALPINALWGRFGCWNHRLSLDNFETGVNNFKIYSSVRLGKIIILEFNLLQGSCMASQRIESIRFRERMVIICLKNLRDNKLSYHCCEQLINNHSLYSQLSTLDKKRLRALINCSINVPNFYHMSQD